MTNTIISVSRHANYRKTHNSLMESTTQQRKTAMYGVTFYFVRVFIKKQTLLQVPLWAATLLIKLVNI